MLQGYTVNVLGNHVTNAKAKGYHAYYANNVTAIEIKAKSKEEAASIARQFGRVLYVFL
jgi:hypothetical protein